MGIIKIDNCRSCRDLVCKRADTADSFAFAEDWFCTYASRENPRKVAGHVSWHASSQPQDIPVWCPRRVKGT